jgi:hypothetical protein
MTKPNTGKCFPTYFSLHYQTSENTFPEFTFPGIHFPKENYFPANKRGLDCDTNICLKCFSLKNTSK